MSPPPRDPPDGSPTIRLRATVGLIVALQGGAAVAFGFLAHRAGGPAGSLRSTALLVLCFALAGTFSLRLEFRRHQTTFTLADAVLTAGFFVAGPAGLGIAAALGEAISLGWRRTSPLKIVFNAGNRLGAATVAATAFALTGRSDPSDAVAWAAALGAALVFSLIDIAATSAVVAVAEGSRFDHVFLNAAGTSILTTVAAAPIGPVTLALWERGALAPLLLVPVVIAVALNSRHAAAQRDEHLRYERLYQASSRTVRLAAFRDVLAALAGEARDLGTGTAAVCAARDQSGEWIGMLVDDAGPHAVEAAALGWLTRLAAGGPRELDLDSAGWAASGLGARPAPVESVVVAPSSPGLAESLILLVMRPERSDPDGRAGRVQTLAAFANHAALSASNAGLFEELEDALARQIDLNRQKGEFVAAVSHELRTPLAAMLGSIETLRRLDGALAEAERDELMRVSVEQGARLRKLIDELLVVAAAEHSQALRADDDVDVAALVHEVARDTTYLAGDRVDVEVPVDVPRLRSDAGKLRQVLTNLVENAAKYAPDGPIEVRVAVTAATMRFAVVDHGPGVPPTDRERVFERFVQLDQSSTRRQGGTGLGLYLCRQLAGVLGGTVELAQTPAGGSTFTIEVPRHPDPLFEDFATTYGAPACKPDGPTTAPPGVRARPAVAPPGVRARPAVAPPGVRARPEGVPAGVRARPAATPDAPPTRPEPLPAGVRARPEGVAAGPREP